MGRQYCKGLTKQELLDMGIYQVDWDQENQEWWIDRYWFKNNSQTIREHRKLKLGLIVKHHKYGQTKVYPKVQINYKNKPYAIPLSRFLYAWFIDDIPDGYVVDHIDNNPFNNHLDNLQLLSIEENLCKRYDDNPNSACNQWAYMDEFDRACDKYQRHVRRTQKELEAMRERVKKLIEEIDGEK